MMSSEEETDCFAKQDRLLLKKNRRTRQRVDAGEPRNSYASIPNFSSRPPAPPYLLSSPPPPLPQQSPSSSTSFVGNSGLIHGGAFLNLGPPQSPSPNNGWLFAADHDRGTSPMIDSTTVSANNNNNKDNLAATKGGAHGGELRHLHPLMSYRHQRSPIRALQRSPHHQQQQGGQRAQNFRRRSHSLDNNNLLGSDIDQQQQDGVTSDCVVDEFGALNGNNNNNNNNGGFRDSDCMAPQQHGPGHHQSRSRGAAGRGSPAGSTSSATSSTNNEVETPTATTNSSSSQLLREILQGGSGAAKLADSMTNGRSGSPATRASFLSGSSSSNNENGTKSTNGSLISHLLSKNNSLQSPISGRTRNNTNKNKSSNATAATAPPENKEEDEEMGEGEREATAPAPEASSEVDGTLVQGSSFANDPEDDGEEMEEEEEEGTPEVEEIAAGAGVATRSRQSRAKMNGERSQSSLAPETEFEAAIGAVKRPRRLVIDEKPSRSSNRDSESDDEDDEAADAHRRQVAAASSGGEEEGEEEGETTPPLAPEISLAAAAALDVDSSSSAFATPQNAETARPQSQSQPTDAELKRARVEKLISTMRSSPSRTAPGEGPAVNGCKKRKRYMPQQHEARVATSVLSSANSDGGGRLSPGFDEDEANAAEEEEFLATMAPATKMRRTHQQVVLRHQLNLMQAQIVAIQQKLDTYGQPESSDSEAAEAEASAYNSDDGQQSNSGFATAGSRPTPPPRPASMPARADSPMMDDDLPSPGPPALYHRYGFSAQSGNSEVRIASAPSQPQPPPMVMRKSPRTPDLEPAHFIDEARRLVYEQERVTKEADNRKAAPPALSVAAMTSSSPAEPKVAVTAAAAAAAVAAASGPVPRPPFAVVPPDWESLADTLKAGMSTLIDDWVRRFASSARPSSAGPLLAALVKADGGIGKESCRPVTGASIQTSVAPGNPATPSSSSSVAANASSATLMTTAVSMGNGNSFHHHHHHQSLGGGLVSSASAAAAAASSHLADRRSPRTKVIDRGRMSAGGPMPPGVSLMGPGGVSAVAAAFLNSTAVHHFNDFKPEQNSMSGLFSPHHHKPGGGLPLYMPHHPGPPPPHHQMPPSLASFYSQHRMPQGGGQGGRESPEQSEALPLVVTPKKKRHKVTDTRITPRTVSRLLEMESASGGGRDGKFMLGGGGGQGGGGGGTSPAEMGYGGHHQHPHHHHSHPPPPMVPVSLPTSVAIPNPGLHQSDVFSPYPYFHPSHQPRASPGSDGMDDSASLFHPSHPHHQALHSTLLLGQRSPDPMHLSARNALKTENGGDSSDCNSGDLMYSNDGTMPTSSTLTPMHLRKAKLMFFFVRYPSSAILKTYFPDIQFNKNNTAQLVKWFSNFREFYYIQMEKYARQAISEGCKNAEDITVTVDSELYRVINLHYNRNNHIEVPTNFRFVVEQTLREFFKAVSAGKDTEQSWKKSIYKVIARLDDNLPDYFKSPNFLEQLE